ncbi:MAG TPA: anthrone oxygenase family protein [Actinoplanes sp.]|jgi:uncharacterized membrane protein|nr:anthrone oxygenase family protein [Actinoplanes sp.]
MDVLLIAATLTTGLMAGLFYAYSVSVMPALRGADAAVFVEVMQRINRAILNGWFFLSFAGAAVLGVAAVVGYLIAGARPALLLPVIAGAVLYLAQLAVTARVNIPLNNALDAAGSADPAAARAGFEARWVAWNHARTWLCTASLGSYCWALLQA